MTAETNTYGAVMSAVAIPTPIPARHRNVNRAEICDQNFIEFVQ